ncbi:SctK family type III secretion system sorting platform protein [Burkholderia vietnamiensis]|uniref:SctK family type III secretion system sorting platform protein n=1 Tax=Burkholderia vietnamiensis TaxID=60552 RepID=UPI001B90A28F|nr:SctK family type III secretion system sorting platform protein [Burkholderia vietnamiensis]MBR8206999.1 SctK family type III secretion system sorting platform protein [Burkholderia vietnamiensis]MCA8015583.1 Yop proteins translocation protein K [Burkholderia vietnamiensis]MCA8390932.1 Yop proteins translocation protein K [Burkholderia vietnamiensis]HDR8937112.1 SctK family type III secretion system sorting platform protein [Burkholderia vietnamiensis]HDR8956815.1 SctK family type III secret
MSEVHAASPGAAPDAVPLPWLQPLGAPPAARRAAFHALVCEFNLRPDRYLHVTRVPAAWPARYRSLDAFGLAGRRLLARHLLDAHGVAGRYDFDVADPCARLALLPGAALEQLAAYAGLLLHRGWLRDALNVRRIRAEVAAKLGGDALELALERAPEFGALADTLEPWRADPAALPAVIRARGARLLADFIGVAGDAVGVRARLKFNRACDDEAPYWLNRAQRDQFGELLFLFLIPERLASWDWLF